MALCLQGVRRLLAERLNLKGGGLAGSLTVQPGDHLNGVLSAERGLGLYLGGALEGT